MDWYNSCVDRTTAARLIRQAVDREVALPVTAQACGTLPSEDIAGNAPPGGRSSRREPIRQVVEAQLRRLRTDRFDGLTDHRPYGSPCQ